MTTTIFIAFAVVTAILLGGGLWLRARLNAGQTLAATLAAIVSLLGTALNGAYLWDGPAIVTQGAGPMADVLPFFEQRFADLRMDSRRTQSFSVWVLGDSTHQSRGNELVHMAPAIIEAAQKKGVTGLRVYGVQNANCNAYEFYFLMNRLAMDPPDLVVMPLNLRAFGSRWLDDSRNGFPVMERYVQWQRIPEAVRLSARGRQITGVGVVLRKLDWILFGSRGEWFLNGLKLRIQGDAPEESDSNERPAGIETAPRRTREEALTWMAEFRRSGEAVFEPRIDDTHALIPVFKAIEGIAAVGGCGVMYYTVQTPDPRAHQQASFTSLRWALSGRPGIRFVEMLDVLQPEDFERMEHFYPSGMRRVASRLVDEIVAARDDEAWRESIPAKAR